MSDPVADLCLTHFLCAFNPKSRPRLTRDIVREVARMVYSEDQVEEFIADRLHAFQKVLVAEFNERFDAKRPVRYQIVDSQAIGSKVAGYQRRKLARETRFQNSLARITDREFELLSAIVLQVLGCDPVFATPASRDQGVDAFGQVRLVAPTPYGLTHSLTWVAQAKHYSGTKVSTDQVRELVGSTELLLSKVFADVDVRYVELRLRPWGPTAIALVTTEEVPMSVRRLADGAGIFVFAASDLYHLLSAVVPKPTVTNLRAFIRRRSKRIRVLG